MDYIQKQHIGNPIFIIVVLFLFEGSGKWKLSQDIGLRVMLYAGHAIERIRINVATYHGFASVAI